ncbi:MAG: SGNH/GDSL hydrolase family protein [Acidobacteria bacterium]|nr:SGNH/GDSL hydrolase family protein [Acidobacteriota bacterium]
MRLLIPIVGLLAGAVALAVPAASGAASKPSSKKKTARRRAAPRAPAVSAKTRAEANRQVLDYLARALEYPPENPAALIPFFERLYRHERGEAAEPVRILHFGDSHTAADEWTGALRALFQQQFGDGGAGFSFAGKPFRGYRRLDLRGGATRAWITDGLAGKNGDGQNGLGGISIRTRLPGQEVFLVAGCSNVEVFFLRQPGGGSLMLYDNGSAAGKISTSGDPGPGYHRYTTAPGLHRLELETLDRAPVRLYGWVTENERGVTYEALGINGAQASIVFRWDEALLADQLARRSPALIVLAYGTNEAGSRDWTEASYKLMFSALIQRLRQAAPAASILVIGPLDRLVRARGKWTPHPRIDMIAAAQREAALGAGCAFWDLREKMGGKGSMRKWVLAGLAQYDHVHFTAPGYRLLGETCFRDLIGQYAAFTKIREEVAGQSPNGQTSPNH